MNNKPKLAINTPTASKELNGEINSRHYPLDSFESSDLMQMRSQEKFSQEKNKDGNTMMFLQDQSNKEGIPSHINPFIASQGSMSQMINVVDQAT